MLLLFLATFGCCGNKCFTTNSKDCKTTCGLDSDTTIDQTSNSISNLGLVDGDTLYILDNVNFESSAELSGIYICELNIYAINASETNKLTIIPYRNQFQTVISLSENSSPIVILESISDYIQIYGREDDTPANLALPFTIVVSQSLTFYFEEGCYWPEITFFNQNSYEINFYAGSSVNMDALSVSIKATQKNTLIFHVSATTIGATETDKLRINNIVVSSSDGTKPTVQVKSESNKTTISGREDGTPTNLALPFTILLYQTSTITFNGAPYFPEITIISNSDYNDNKKATLTVGSGVTTETLNVALQSHEYLTLVFDVVLTTIDATQTDKLIITDNIVISPYGNSKPSVQLKPSNNEITIHGRYSIEYPALPFTINATSNIAITFATGPHFPDILISTETNQTITCRVDGQYVTMDTLYVTLKGSKNTSLLFLGVSMITASTETLNGYSYSLRLNNYILIFSQNYSPSAVQVQGWSNTLTIHGLSSNDYIYHCLPFTIQPTVNTNLRFATGPYFPCIAFTSETAQSLTLTLEDDITMDTWNVQFYGSETISLSFSDVKTIDPFDISCSYYDDADHCIENLLINDYIVITKTDAFPTVQVSNSNNITIKRNLNCRKGLPFILKAMSDITITFEYLYCFPDITFIADTPQSVTCKIDEISYCFDTVFGTFIVKEPITLILPVKNITQMTDDVDKYIFGYSYKSYSTNSNDHVLEIKNEGKLLFTLETGSVTYDYVYDYGSYDYVYRPGIVDLDIDKINHAIEIIPQSIYNAVSISNVVVINIDTSQLTIGSDNQITIKRENDVNSSIEVTLEITTKESSSISLSQNDILFSLTVNIGDSATFELTNVTSIEQIEKDQYTIGSHQELIVNNNHNGSILSITLDKGTSSSPSTVFLEEANITGKIQIQAANDKTIYNTIDIYNVTRISISLSGQIQFGINDLITIKKGTYQAPELTILPDPFQFEIYLSNEYPFGTNPINMEYSSDSIMIISNYYPIGKHFYLKQSSTSQLKVKVAASQDLKTIEALFNNQQISGRSVTQFDFSKSNAYCDSKTITDCTNNEWCGPLFKTTLTGSRLVFGDILCVSGTEYEISAPKYSMLFIIATRETNLVFKNIENFNDKDNIFNRVQQGIKNPYSRNISFECAEDHYYDPSYCYGCSERYCNSCPSGKTLAPGSIECTLQKIYVYCGDDSKCDLGEYGDTNAYYHKDPSNAIKFDYKTLVLLFPESYSDGISIDITKFNNDQTVLIGSSPSNSSDSINLLDSKSVTIKKTTQLKITQDKEITLQGSGMSYGGASFPDIGRSYLVVAFDYSLSISSDYGATTSSTIGLAPQTKEVTLNIDSSVDLSNKLFTISPQSKAEKITIYRNGETISDKEISGFIDTTGSSVELIAMHYESGGKKLSFSAIVYIISFVVVVAIGITFIVLIERTEKKSEEAQKV